MSSISTSKRNDLLPCALHPAVIVTLDPGLNHCGVAVWVDERLQTAELVRVAHETGTERAGKWQAMGKAVARLIPAEAWLVTEIPQVYTREHSKGDPNDLIDLAGVVGAVVGASNGSVEWSPVPREWKGQLPKEVTAQRVMNALKPGEHGSIRPCPPSLLHNVYDAIHLGLVYMKREGLRS